VEHRAAEFVGHPQPRDPLPIAEEDLFGGIDLPDLVGGRGPPSRGGGPSARWCRGESGAMEPALEGAFGREGPDPLLPQVDSDQASAPGGMIPTQLDGGLEGGMGAWRIRVVAVSGCQAPCTLLTPPSQEVPDSAWAQVEGLTQLGGRRSMFPTTPHGLPEGQWHRGRHGQILRGDTVYHARAPRV
jgi:hypothetical protein